METLQGSCPHDLLTTLLTLAPAQPSANELNWKSAGEVVKLRTAAWSRASSQVGQIVKLRQGSGKDRQGMAVRAKGLKA